jgi:group I intron endonuclease
MKPIKLSRLIPVSGIYKITNSVNKKVYIGKSINIKARWFNHVSDLTSGKHVNKGFLRDFQLMGAGVFVAELIEKCDKSCLLEREWYYMNQYHKNGYELYNITGWRGDSRFDPDNNLSETDWKYIEKQKAIRNDISLKGK